MFPIRIVSGGEPMKIVKTAVILSAFWATSAGAAVIQFDTQNPFGPATMSEAASPKAATTFPARVPGAGKSTQARRLGGGTGRGSIGMWLKPSQSGIAPATSGASGVIANEESGGGLGVVPLPGAFLLLAGALAAAMVVAGLRRRRMVF